VSSCTRKQQHHLCLDGEPEHHGGQALDGEEHGSKRSAETLSQQARSSRRCAPWEGSKVKTATAKGEIWPCGQWTGGVQGFSVEVELYSAGPAIGLMVALLASENISNVTAVTVLPNLIYI